MGIVGYKPTADPELWIATDVKKDLQEEFCEISDEEKNVMKIFDNQKLPVLCGQCWFVFSNGMILNHRLKVYEIKQ